MLDLHTLQKVENWLATRRQNIAPFDPEIW